MKKCLAVLLLLIIVLAGCSEQTLQDAISSSAYGDYDKPEILYRNDDIGVVIFLTKDENNEFVLCRSTYEKNRFNRYDLRETDNDYSISVDIGRKSEFITVDTIDKDSDNPLHLVWGSIFHHPGAEQVVYKVHNQQGDRLYENKVEINNKHIFVDIVPEQVTNSYAISFDIVDQEGNIVFSKPN
jgi:hypothetical protein